MCDFYGEEGALSLCICILEEIHEKHIAARLRDKTQTDSGPAHLKPETFAKDFRLRYTHFVKETFQIWTDENSLPGEYDLLNNRYSQLIILDHHRHEVERKHEIMSLGKKHSQIMRNRAHSSITIDSLFKPDKCKRIPQIVVLQGAAGIGKTMTVRKIMLDWACGELYQDMFDYVLYIHCRKMNLYAESSIVDIILQQCAKDDAYNEILRNEIIRNPKKLLFIVDGFDELRFSLDQPEDHLCSDPRKKEPVDILLRSLLRKKVLPESYLIVTTRPTALEKLRKCLECSRYAEILGFSEEDRRRYFHKFFQNKNQAAQAFKLVRQNETLFTMCFVPIVCWIVCTVIKQQLERKENFPQTSKTLTAVYMLYLSSLLKSHKSGPKQHMAKNLRSLCSLAADGIWKQEILFWEEEIKKRGLDQDDSLPLFLNETIFKRDIDCKCSSSFIHLSFQEFFAALSYLLNSEKRHCILLCVRGQSNESDDMRALLESYVTSRPDLALTVRFFFGLLNEEKEMKDMKKHFGWKVSPKIKEILLKWVKNNIKSKIREFSSTDLWLLECLYEINDEHFVKGALDHVTEIELDHFFLTEMEEMALAYCLEHCCCLEVFSLQYIPIEPEVYKEEVKEEQEEEICTSSQLPLDGQEYHYPTPQEQLYKAVKSLKGHLRILRLTNCVFTSAQWKDLSPVLCTYPRLSELKMVNIALKESGMRLLAGGLKHQDCRIQTLGLSDCRLTAGCCKDLSSVLITNQTLVHLDVSWNMLGDSGIKLLCEGLEHPDCKLQSLRLSNCYFTDACCGDLAEVLCTNQTLRDLVLSHNKIEDTGMKQLCTRLKHPRCKLERLRLKNCSVTEASCGDLSSVLSTNQNLMELQLNSNNLRYSGVKLLCEGLEHPNCRLKVIGLGSCSPKAQQELDIVKQIKPHLVIF
ncbi:NACHT, LRR and PYD domains-containing protein 3-like [Tiliqua scincoides]|uniref:NACHT, LRR and PYD domains-containing protein 3-like n=1 Tax=Tiliqua scincoides TaxID=71010 RepID=UPI003462A0DA